MQTLAMNQLTGEDTGKYQINRLLGQGPVSSFYEASAVTGERVMLTAFYLPESFSSQARSHFLRRFEQTGAVLVKLKHPSILPVRDFGEHRGYPYLITPFVPGRSLAHGLRVRGQFPVEAVLEILPLIADGLDYAHREGVVHGVLSPSNILLAVEPKVQVAGFGLMRILARQGLEQSAPSAQTHLLNVAGGFLGAPAYMAPELINRRAGQGSPFEPRIDVYALGVLLFEMLSGRLPFNGETPQEIEQLRSQLPIPSLSSLLPTLPASVDAVIARALAATPEQRFPSAGALAQAFVRVVAPSRGFSLQGINGESDITGPLVINWLAENVTPTGTQAVPGQVNRTGSAGVAGPGNPQEFDPFAWWANTSSTRTVANKNQARPTPARPGAAANGQKVSSNKPGRRKVVALLAGGTVAVAAAGVGGEFVITRLLQRRDMQNTTTQANTTSQKKSQPAKAVTKQSTKGTAKPPTAQPTKAVAKPKPPQHTGTVIASTTMPVNSAINFTDAASGQSNVLIHLQNGNYVAYNRACTHVGVPVNYDPGAQQLICPAHGAVFDPANGGVLQPPANSPLPAVTIHVNTDGTITV